MKVNLLYDYPNGIRSGYLNIDPFAPDGDPNVVRADIFNLEMVEDGEAEELVAHDILPYCSPANVNKIIPVWFRKIAHGGTIVLGALETRNIAKRLMQYDLTIDQFNEFIHGTSHQRQSSFTLQQMVEVVNVQGFQVLQKRVVDGMAVVVGRRK